MSGVFSIVAQVVLQYFSDVTVQEQMGCAHLVSLAVSISFLLRKADGRMCFCSSRFRWRGVDQAALQGKGEVKNPRSLTTVCFRGSVVNGITVHF